MVQGNNVQEILIGNVSHYLVRTGEAVVQVITPLMNGDHIHIIGGITDFQMTVDSVENDTHHMSFHHSGYQMAIKVTEWVREGDRIYIYDYEED